MERERECGRISDFPLMLHSNFPHPCWRMAYKTSLLYKRAQGDFPILSPFPFFLFVLSTLTSSLQSYSQRTFNVMENFHDTILIIFSMSNNRHIFPIWETIYMHIKKAERMYIKYYQQAIPLRFYYRWLLFSCLCFLCFPNDHQQKVYFNTKN